jgi:hypothetical protein
MDTDKLLILAVLGINAIATIFISVKPSDERESKVWQLYTASVTGLYGYALANDRNKASRDRQDDEDDKTQKI